jgi:hypothetical protein
MTEQIAVSGKDRLLALMREVAVASTEAKHKAKDDGEGRCVTCGRNVHRYEGVLQHQRGWGGSAVGNTSVPLTVLQLSHRLGLGEHETGHLMWSLQKQGMVTFRTGNGPGTATDISRIRLTPLGAGKTSKPEPVNNREAIKQIEDAVFKGNGLDVRQDALDVLTTGQHTPLFHPEVEAARHGETQVVEPVLPSPINLDPAEYPLIVDLLSRAAKRRQVQEAALMLENAGFIDLATSALTAVPDNTDLEQEVLDLLADHGAKG